MISYFEASIKSLSVHRVGNQAMDEGYSLSEGESSLSQQQNSYLLYYFLRPFEKVNEVYNFYHPSGDLSLNAIYPSLFSSEYLFHEFSKEIAKHLFEVSNHPKIKGGEVYVAYFENIQIDGDLLPAIGIFKSEKKEAYLKVSPVSEGFALDFESDAINIQNLDKGCLIFNTDRSNGFKVVSIDTRGTKDAAYWMDEFLGLKIVNNDYTKTKNVLSLCKSFINNKLDEEFEISSADKAELLNNSLKYFKEKESFDMEEYGSEVLKNPGAAGSFKNYASAYGEEFDADIPACFNISSPAVKKSSSVFKPVLKLDKNFSIYVHGDKELIQKGFDEDKQMNFYKVFFKEEQ